MISATCITILLAAGYGWAESPVPHTINVTGTAITRVAPDIASWNIMVWDQGALADAKASNEQKTQAVLGVIRSLGVAPEDVQTDYVRVEQQYDYNLYPRRVSLGWVVARSIKFKQHDLLRFDEFVDQLLDMADVDVRYSLETSRYHELRKETRLNALKIAKEKAEAMCSAVGSTLGSVNSIQEQPPYHAPSYDPMWGWGSWGAGAPQYTSNSAVVEPSSTPALDELSDQTTLAPGLIEIVESVKVAFDVNP